MAEKRKLAFYIRLSDADEEVKDVYKRQVFYADYGYFLFYHIHTVWCINAPYHYRTLFRRIQGGGLCNDSI